MRLADDTGHPLRVRVLAVRVTESKLGQIAPKVRDADVMMRPVDRPLELREEVLGLVRGHVAADVLPGAVVDREVLALAWRKTLVMRTLVRVKHDALNIDRAAHRGGKVLAGHVRNDLRDDPPVSRVMSAMTGVLSVLPWPPLPRLCP